MKTAEDYYDLALDHLKRRFGITWVQNNHQEVISLARFYAEESKPEDSKVGAEIRAGLESVSRAIDSFTDTIRYKNLG